MTPDAKKVLIALADFQDEDYPFLNFYTLMKSTELPRNRVRFCCRYLARQGLAEFRRGLWTEDGEMYGSGYRCTELGSAQLKSQS